MPIERHVTVKAPKYRAAVSYDGTPTTATIADDVVEISRPGARAILRVPIAEWQAFLFLIDSTSTALLEKAHLEAATLPLPWEQSAAPEVEALVEAAPGGPDDAASALPVVPAVEPGTPIPPRVSA